MDKLRELKRTKRLALGLLLLAAATFITTLFLPPNFWVSGVKAIAEAAMVGALADWFAAIKIASATTSAVSCRRSFWIPTRCWR